MPILDTLEDHDIDFIQGEVKEIDIESKRITYCPVERPGAALENINYDYLVLALGSQLAYDKIKGFGKYGQTVSDTYYGTRLQKYLFDGGYKGGPIAVGSDLFHQGLQGKPDWLPVTQAACEGPPLEVSLSMATWLKDHDLGGPDKITMFTPGEMIAEDAGEKIVNEFLGMAKEMGFHYMNNTQAIQEITADGIQFSNGKSLEAELKILMPDWVPLGFLKELPITDEVGFVLTDDRMRNEQYPEIFAVGDCAALTVPKLGSLGHQQAEIVGKQIAKDLGMIKADEADKSFKPEIICFGDMGDNKGFYIHSNQWYGGDTSVFKMGFTYYAMKVAFKELYYETGGKPPGWGIPLTEIIADHLTP
jgi:sulfide:quinone oxidoreductase